MQRTQLGARRQVSWPHTSVLSLLIFAQLGLLLLRCLLSEFCDEIGLDCPQGLVQDSHQDEDVWSGRDGGGEGIDEVRTTGDIGEDALGPVQVVLRDGEDNELLSIAQ